MTRDRRTKKAGSNTRAKNRTRKYRVTVLPTFGPMEIIAENEKEAEELADYYWDAGWDGEFITEVEEMD